MTARRLALALTLLALPTAATAQSPAPQTTWANDHAQFVIQSIDADGRLAGTYTNHGAGFGCAGRAFPVTGWIDGDMVSFTVHRKEPANCTTIQAWTGFVREGQLLVEYLAVATEGGRTGLIKGSDRYRRQ
jgi:avidin family protein